MDVYKTIINRRTIRVFEDKKIPKEKLEKLVNAARMAPSASNLQPLEYLVVNNKKLCNQVFKNVTFGGGVEKLQTKEKRPAAYILILANKKIRESGFEHDVGLAVENIVLSAWEEAIGACIMGAVNREGLAEILKVPSYYSPEAGKVLAKRGSYSPKEGKVLAKRGSYFIDLVVALGYSAEKPKVVDAENVSYQRSKENILYVPKRPLSKILHWNKF